MSILVIIGAIVFLILCLRFLRDSKCVGIVVYGDIGRSPRMQYHAISFSKSGFYVVIFSLGGSIPHKKLINDPKISIKYLHQFPIIFQEKLSPILYLSSKVIWQSIDLFLMLLISLKPSKYLLQNPPSLPAMGICWLIGFLKSNELIIDWHNYGYTIMAMSLNSQHVFVKLYKKFEFFFAKLTRKHICVSNKMKEDLKIKININVLTMYDRAPDIFQPQPISNRHSFFQKLDFLTSDERDNLDGNLFTEMKKDVVLYKENRPALIISSTSWTADEDFGILFEAFDDYDEQCKFDRSVLPNIICVITGKGPLKNLYMKQCLNRWTNITIHSPWLTAEDYPILLGSADLGICLHTSSSGLDLPMKVVDMFGCGLPVCAIKYPCINELIENNKNGILVSDSSELSNALKELLCNFPKNKKLMEMGLNLTINKTKRWHENWTDIVLPLINS